MVLAVFLLYEAEPVAGYLHHIGQFLVYLLHLVLDAGDVLLGLILVELQDAGHLDFHQSEDIVLRHLAHHLGVPGSQTLVNPFAGSIHRLGILELLILIDALFDEDLFQCGKMKGLHQFAPADESFLLQQVQRRIYIPAQHIADRKETRLLLVNHTTVGRDADFAVGTGIEGIYGLVAAGSRRQVNQNLCLVSRQILHVTYLYLALLVGFQDTLYEGAGLAGRSCSLSVRNLRNGQCLVVALLYLGTNAYHAAALTVVVTRDVYAAACGEIGIQVELLVMQILDGCIADLVQVVGQNLTVQSYGNTLGSLCQQQGELNGQGNRFLVSAVVRELPLCSLGIEYHIQGELAQAGLYVTASCSIVASDDVTPVSLAVNQQVFLSQLYQGILDTGISVGMELHGVTNDVSHLVVSAVIHAFHGVHDTSLYGFETVTDMGNCTFQDYIRSIIQEPVLVHFVKMMGNPIHHIFVLCHQESFILPTNVAKNIDSAKLIGGKLRVDLWEMFFFRGDFSIPKFGMYVPKFGMAVAKFGIYVSKFGMEIFT